MAQLVLKIENLHGYYGESHALQGVSLEVNEGETITLLGRNGAGKTTTLRAIIGILDDRRGSIKLRGEEIIALPSYKIGRAGVGYVPEERGIFATLTVEENLLLPPRVADGGMSLEEIYELFPNLLERRTSPGTKLSGGEQQMLAMARVLRTGARLLLLDEPTEGLAPVIIQRIGEVIAMLRSKGFTIILVEQNFRFAAKLADRHYVMEDGHVVDTFPNSALEAKSDELHKFLGV